MAKKGEKLLALMLVAALVLGGGNGGVIQAAEDYEVKDPVNTMADGTGITTWDCVYFGNYIQKDTNGDGKVTDEDEKQPIKWRVLSVEEDGTALLWQTNCWIYSLLIKIGKTTGKPVLFVPG